MLVQRTSHVVAQDLLQQHQMYRRWQSTHKQNEQLIVHDQVSISLFFLLLSLFYIFLCGFVFCSSVANRIDTCDSVVKQDLLWLQANPRFGVVDNHQCRPIPDLNPISPLAHASPAATVSRESNDDFPSDDMLQTQINLNAEILQRFDALEAEKKTMAAEIKALRAATDLSKKENTVFNVKLAESSAECTKLKEKLATFKPVAKVVRFTNKENMNEINQQNAASK